MSSDPHYYLLIELTAAADVDGDDGAKVTAERRRAEVRVCASLAAK